jgi:hypothetical protein
MQKLDYKKTSEEGKQRKLLGNSIPKNWITKKTSKEGKQRKHPGNGIKKIG